MKIKYVVATALLVFILVIGNILAIGLLTPEKNEVEINKTPIKNISDFNTNIVIVKKNETNTTTEIIQQEIRNPVEQKPISKASSNSANTNTQNSAPVVQSKPKKVKTRAS
mgnify:CR=1 FL=1